MTRARYINHNGKKIYVRADPLREMTERDFFWPVGIIEGEGCFGIRNNCPFVKVSICDKDVRDKLKQIAGTGSTYDRPPTKGSNKHVYIWQANGWFGRELMLKVQPHMSVRRQTQIVSALNKYHYKGPATGFRNPSTKLRPEEVQEIRRLYATGKILQRELGPMFGVKRGTITSLIARENWAHI